MEGLMPKEEPSSFKIVGSTAKTKFGSKAQKSVNFKILLFENGRLPTSEGRQN